MLARSRSPRTPRAARIMLLILACLAAAAAAPATYDQRQDGEFNVLADVQNVVLLVAVPQKMSLPLDILDGFLKIKPNSREAAQDRADVRVTDAFVEPSTPYRVEIGPDGSERSVEGDGRAVEVVIVGRRRSDLEPQPEAQPEPQPEAQPERDEYKLLGATEQCGPDHERDPVSLSCRLRSLPEPEKKPEVILSSA